MNPNLSRRKMVTTLGAVGVTALAGCSGSLSGTTTLSVEPGGLDTECIDTNELEIDSYIRFTDTEEFSSGGVTRSVELESYLATYTNAWVTMAVATFPIYRIGGTDILPFSAIDLGSEETLNQLIDMEQISDIDKEAEQTVQHDDFDEFTVHEYDATLDTGDTFHVLASEHEILYPEQDDVRMFIFGAYQNEIGGEVPSRVMNMMAASDHPSEVLQERDPEEKSLLGRFDVDSMTTNQSTTNTTEE